MARCHIGGQPVLRWKHRRKGVRSFTGTAQVSQSGRGNAADFTVAGHSGGFPGLAEGTPDEDELAIMAEERIRKQQENARCRELPPQDLYDIYRRMKR